MGSGKPPTDNDGLDEIVTNTDGNDDAVADIKAVTLDEDDAVEVEEHDGDVDTIADNVSEGDADKLPEGDALGEGVMVFLEAYKGRR